MLPILMILVISSAVRISNCHLISLDKDREECFFERLETKTTMKLSFEVLDGASLDVDLIIFNNNNVIHRENKATSGKYTIEASQDGPYKYCFSNTVAPKIVMFSVETAKQIMNKISGSEETRTSDMVTELISLVTGVKLEMEYLGARDRVHWAIRDRINSNINVWTMIETASTFIFALGQTFYIKRFFEVRRRV